MEFSYFDEKSKPPLTWEMLKKCYHPFERKRMLAEYHKWLAKQRKIDRKIQHLAKSKEWRIKNPEKWKESKKKSYKKWKEKILSYKSQNQAKNKI